MAATTSGSAPCEGAGAPEWRRQGGALFCDSCHQGNEHLLAREDKDALNKFMSANYEGKLSRADGEDHGCGTCHGDAFETKIFEKMWKIQ